VGLPRSALTGRFFGRIEYAADASFYYVASWGMQVCDEKASEH